jgi:hypothetical protein
LISFRYHLVSIVGIFLAFALGIAVGTAALNGAVTDGLRSQVNSLRDTRDNLQTENSQLNKQVAAQDSFAQLYGPGLAAGALTGQTVAIIETPGANDSNGDAIAAEVQAAGGKVTGRISLTADYVDPARAADIRSLATGSAHPVGLQLPATDDAGQLGGALLAYVLVGSPTEADIQQVLAGFAALQMVKVKGSAVTAANLAIVVTAGAENSGSNTTAVTMLSSLASQLDSQGKGTVVAGNTPSASKGGLVYAIRNDATVSHAVSTVDDADTSLGQLTTILALAQQKAGASGQYGSAAGADSIAPAPGS